MFNTRTDKSLRNAINYHKETVFWPDKALTQGEVSYANLRLATLRKREPDNPRIWLITWWTCRAQWWMEWKGTLWWWLQLSQPWCGLTHSSQASCLRRSPSLWLKSSDPWHNRESTWRISTSAMSLEPHSTSLLCSVWVRLTHCSWNSRQVRNNTKTNLEKNQEHLQEEWAVTQWWEAWWEQTWWIKAIKTNPKRISSNLKSKHFNW